MGTCDIVVHKEWGIGIHGRREVVYLLPVATGLLIMPAWLSQQPCFSGNQGLDEKLLQAEGNLKFL